jgi:hypothetical protein
VKGHEAKSRASRKGASTLATVDHTKTDARSLKLSEVVDPSERATVQRHHERQNQRPNPRVKIAKEDGKICVASDHPNEAIGNVLLMESLATTSDDFFRGVLAQLVNAGCPGKDVTAEDVNFSLALVAGIQPRDEMEAMLAVQMAVIHNATMTAGRRLARVTTIPQQDSASNMLNKLARTFTAQIEALKRNRSTGEQSIRVQHVTVNDGGQAIVGDVRARGGEPGNSGEQPHEPCGSIAQSTPLLSDVETLAATMPGAGSERVDRMPLSRRARRST